MKPWRGNKGTTYESMFIDDKSSSVKYSSTIATREKIFYIDHRYSNAWHHAENASPNSKLFYILFVHQFFIKYIGIFFSSSLCWYINKVWILNYYIITVSMPMKTVFNITNYKIKPEEILELLRKLKTSCDLGFPLQSATWLAGFPPKHSLTFYLLHKYTFLAYKYQSLRTLILTLSVTSPIYTVSWY